MIDSKIEKIKTFVDNDQKFNVNKISEVEWGEIFFATFNYNNIIYGIDIVKNLAPKQIFNELLYYEYQ